jgi:hypothetical protein
MRTITPMGSVMRPPVACSFACSQAYSVAIHCLFTQTVHHARDNSHKISRLDGGGVLSSQEHIGKDVRLTRAWAGIML